MASKPGRIVVMWGHLALLAVIAAVVIYYWMDTRAVSMRTVNLLLVQPASIFALLLILGILPQCFRRLGEGEEIEKESLSDLGRVFALMAAFITFALSMQRVGFDVATFAFMVVGLFLCGERNWFLNIGFSAVFTALLIWGYGAIIPFPFPLTIL